MEQNTDNSIAWYVCMKQHNTDTLAAIRHWGNLYLGVEEDLVWIKGFDAMQIQAKEVQCLPFVARYYTRHQMLVRLGSLLPDRGIPQLSWTDIATAQPLDRPAFNHNYFGLQGSLPIALVQDAEEKKAAALMVLLNVLDGYITTAPAHRLHNLSWCVIDAKYALVTGTPVLPLPGLAFWQQGNACYPVGYKLNLWALAQQVYDMLCPQPGTLLFWQQDGSYFTIPEDDFQPLSRGSYRRTLML